MRGGRSRGKHRTAANQGRVDGRETKFQGFLRNKFSEEIPQNSRSRLNRDLLPIGEIVGRAHSPNPIGRRILS